MARYSEAQNKATQKYISKAYDQFSVRVPKGKREIYKAHAEARYKAVNQVAKTRAHAAEHSRPAPPAEGALHNKHPHRTHRSR